MSRSGISAQLGFAEETTWGTVVTPDRFLPLVSESLSNEIERLESEAIVAGRLTLDADGWAPGGKSASGDLNLELYNAGIGLLLEHALGAVETTGTDPYTHEFTPALLFGKGLTVQIGRPGVAGTVHPFTYSGCKVASWELTAEVGSFARLTLSLVGKEETTATEALAEVSYPAGLKPFRFTHGTLSLGGSAFKVKGATISGENALDTDRRFLGTDVIDEPIDNGLRTYGGNLTAEFTDLTAYNRFVNGTTAALELAFTNGTETLTVAMGAVRFDGTTPQVGGREVLELPLPFKSVAASDAAALTITVVNGDATP